MFLTKLANILNFICQICNFFTFLFTCFARPLQKVNGVYSKLDVPPLSGHAGISPATQLGTILYKNIRRSRGRQSALA